MWRMAILGGVVLASALLPVDLVERGPILCAFRHLTGVPCPGCGLTRSFVETAHLDLTGAFSHHLFGPLAFALCVLVLVADVLAATRRVRIDTDRLLARMRRPLQVLAAVWIAWAIWRIS